MRSEVWMMDGEAVVDRVDFCCMYVCMYVCLKILGFRIWAGKSEDMDVGEGLGVGFGGV